MKHVILLLLLFTFLGCQKSEKPSYGKKVINPTSNDAGKKLMESKCYVCHGPSQGHDNRVAPPMIAVKKHYISENTTKKEFIENMQAWIKNPSADISKMPGAVRKFGVMPKQYFSEKTIQLISEYMFDNEIEEPAWFQKHYEEERGQGKGNGHGKGQGKGKMKGKMMQQSTVNLEALPYGERGQKYALSTKAVLGRNLMGKLQKKGTIEALKFCNLKAYSLTDSMAVVHNASIKRVTDKPRNQANLASNEEFEYIKRFKEDVANNVDSKPIVVETSELVNVYYPIKTNGMCLQCHGDTKQISQATLATIKNLYPKDRATGYDINQVRGIWNVSFSK